MSCALLALGIFYGILGLFCLLGELCWLCDDYTKDRDDD